MYCNNSETVCWTVVQAIRDILLLGHRQAFTWIDEWYGKYARRPMLSPVSTTRVDGPSWRVTSFHYRSTRVVNSASGNARPSTRPVLTGNGNRSPVKSGSGNRALVFDVHGASCVSTYLCWPGNDFHYEGQQLCSINQSVFTALCYSEIKCGIFNAQSVTAGEQCKILDCVTFVAYRISPKCSNSTVQRLIGNLLAVSVQL